MEHRTSRVGDTVEIALSGRFTFADHANFRALLAELDGGARICVLEMSQLSFIDSAAMGMLLLARETAAGKGASVAIKGAQGQVRQLMKIANFERLFTIQD